MGREAWHATVHGVAKSRTQMSNWTEVNCKIPHSCQILQVRKSLSNWRGENYKSQVCFTLCVCVCMLVTKSHSLWSHELNPARLLCHGIVQARILEWVASSFSKGSSQPRDWTQVSHTVGRFFTIWAPHWGGRNYIGYDDQGAVIMGSMFSVLVHSNGLV